MRTVKPSPPAGGTMVRWKWSHAGSSGPEHPAALGTTGPPVQLTTGEAWDRVPDAGDAAKAREGVRNGKRSAASTAQRPAGWRTTDPREETSRLIEVLSCPKERFLPIQNMFLCMSARRYIRCGLFACGVP
jgi:hypothetical protein